MHLVHKHIIYMETENQPFGKEIQNTISEVLKNSFYPKLEKLLQKYNPKNAIWNIDFLPITLNNIHPKNWEKGVVEESLIQIEKYLEEHKPKEIAVNTKVNKQINRKIYIQNLFFTYLKSSVLKPNSISNRLAIIFKELTVDAPFIKKIDELLFNTPKFILRWSLNVPQKIKLDYLQAKGITFDLNITEKLPKTTEYLEYLHWTSLLNAKTKIKQLKKEALTHYNIDNTLFLKLIEALSKKETYKKKNTTFKVFIKKLVKASKTK